MEKTISQENKDFFNLGFLEGKIANRSTHARITPVDYRIKRKVTRGKGPYTILHRGHDGHWRVFEKYNTVESTLARLMVLIGYGALLE